MDQKIIGLNVRKTLKSLFSFHLKKSYLLALFLLFASAGFTDENLGAASRVTSADARVTDYIDLKGKWDSLCVPYDKDASGNLASLLAAFECSELWKDKTSNKAKLNFLAKLATDNIKLKPVDEVLTKLNSKFDTSEVVKTLKQIQEINKSGSTAKFKLENGTYVEDTSGTIDKSTVLTQLKAQRDREASTLSDEESEKIGLLFLNEDNFDPEETSVQTLIELHTEHQKKDVEGKLKEVFENDKLKGVQKSELDALIKSTSDSEDLPELMKELARLDLKERKEALQDLAGVAHYAGVDRVALRNHTLLANSILDAVKGGSQFWLNPIGYAYKQGKKDGYLTSFKAKSGGMSGAILGGDEDLSFGVHGGFLYSQLESKNEKEKATLKTIHFGPVLHLGGYDNWFLNTLVDVSRGSHQGERQVTVGDQFDTNISYKRTSWSGLIGFATGTKVYLDEKATLALVPTLKFNWVNSWQGEFDETSSKKDHEFLTKKIAKRHSSHLNPRFDITLVKDFTMSDCRFSPALRVGYLSYLPLTGGEYTVQSNLHQVEGQTTPWVTYESYEKATHQLILGTEFEIKTSKKGNFATTLSYEAHLGSKAKLQTAFVNFNWKW